MSDVPMSQTLALPVLPLRDVVVYPHMVIPLFVGREKSMRALDRAMEADKRILLVAQTSPEIDDPTGRDLYPMGTVAQVLQLLKLPDGTIKVLAEGVARVAVTDFREIDGALVADAQELTSFNEREPRELEVTMRSLMSLFEQYVKTSRKIPPELLTTLGGIEDPGRVADTIAAHLGIRLTDKQTLLETLDVGARLELLIGYVDGEIDVQQLEKRIRGRVKSQMEKSQREYYLNEQMKAIQRELGDLDEQPNEQDELTRKIAAAKMPKAVEAKARAELNKLRQMAPMSAEATVVRNYIDWLVGVPWSKRSKVRRDLKAAQDVLDADHYGLEKVKERILEYLAVQSRVKQMKGPILCLVGPPGVGKTSLGQSIAKATGRHFVRMSLGGVRDEAEIRGHRRTYIGSLPGNVVQQLRKAGTRNPVFMLDEMDKLGASMHGDPSSALLEVLDPEQNGSFRDNYLGVPFDLSKVFFLGTANVLDAIPGPLRDRMEIIELPGYTQEEKLEIARRYLVKRQLSANGLSDAQAQVDDAALQLIIGRYTREAGVRNLEREIGAVLRNAAVRITEGKAEAVHVGAGNVAEVLGAPRFEPEVALRTATAGVATGLAWTPVGGDILFVEATAVRGKGGLILTGQLGDVMKESAQAAVTLVKARADSLDLGDYRFDEHDLHIHVPAGAIPKDGPSAGVALFTAVASLLTDRKVRSDVAMTGEISLRGLVLPVGGIKEKSLAALRAGIHTVLLPARNRKDLEEIPESARAQLDFIWLETVDDALRHALE